MDDDFVKSHVNADGSPQFVYDADPDKAFYEPEFRPRVAVQNLAEGLATLNGQGGENFFIRTYVDGQV